MTTALGLSDMRQVQLLYFIALDAYSTIGFVARKRLPKRDVSSRDYNYPSLRMALMAGQSSVINFPGVSSSPPYRKAPFTILKMFKKEYS